MKPEELILDALASSEIDSFASMEKPLPHLKSEPRFYVVTLSSVYTPPAAVGEYLQACITRMRELVGPDNKPSQLHFWRFFDNVRDVRKHACAPHGTFEVANEVGHASLGRVFAKNRLELSQGPLIVDGQHRLAALNDTRRDLSSRDILRVLQTVFDRIVDCETTRTFCDVLEILDSSLVDEVAKRVRLKNSRRSFDLQQNTAPSTREWVLGFFFRTGNPPPRSGRSCPADSWAIVNIITEAWREGYATVQRQEDSRSLRNTIRKRYTKARFNRGVRSHANLGGVRQFAGRRCSGRYCSLAQCA
jgi:hypothetical protein